jgi:type IV secretion system protein VirB5
MLQNETTKLQALYQSIQAQEWANAQRMRELAIAGHGQFDSRFQPQP